MVLSTIWIKVKTLAKKIASSIAFYPALIALFLFGLAWLVSLELTRDLDQFIRDKLSFLAIKDPNTTLTLLGSMIGGLMSLTVFSFSMVMVLLNQASSNYSPRLLPGLISNKKHQVVLGIYIGAIIYCIILLLGVIGGDNSVTLPTTGILGAVILSICSIGCFVYFIHSISQSIQIDYIINDLELTAEQYTSQLDTHVNVENFKIADRHRASSEGYLVIWNITEVIDIANRLNSIIRLEVGRGQLVLIGDSLCSSQQILDEPAINDLSECYIISKARAFSPPLEVSIQYLTEIAVRAMSPGINDPMTAIDSIHKLMFLFRKRQGMYNQIIHRVDGKVRVIETIYSYEKLLDHTLTSLHQYCSQDPLVHKTILQLLAYLEISPAAEKPYHKEIIKHLEVWKK